MKTQEKGAMPPIEEFLRAPNTAAGEANIEAAMKFLEDLLRPLMSGMKDWPGKRRKLKELIREDFQAMHGVWRSKVLAAHMLKRDDAERDFHVHMQAGGKREEWTPWKALGVPQLMDWYLTRVIANCSPRRSRDRHGTTPLKHFAEMMLDIGETDALKQFAAVLCGGDSVTASG